MHRSGATAATIALALFAAGGCGDGGSGSRSPGEGGQSGSSSPGTRPGSESGPTTAAGPIAFETDRDGDDEIYLMDPDGSSPRRVTDHPADDFAPDWGPAHRR